MQVVGVISGLKDLCHSRGMCMQLFAECSPSHAQIMVREHVPALSSFWEDSIAPEDGQDDALRTCGAGIHRGQRWASPNAERAISSSARAWHVVGAQDAPVWGDPNVPSLGLHTHTHTHHFSSPPSPPPPPPPPPLSDCVEERW